MFDNVTIGCENIGLLDTHNVFNDNEETSEVETNECVAINSLFSRRIPDILRDILQPHVSGDNSSGRRKSGQPLQLPRFPLFNGRFRTFVYNCEKFK
jgi:hypothetical protein